MDKRKITLIGAAILALLFLQLLIAPGAAMAQERTAAFEPAECMFEGIDLGLTTLTGEALGFECGYVVLPERHDKPDGATIRVPVAIRQATSPNRRPDPLFVAQGGPGVDALRIYTLLLPTTSLVSDRDIVIFNQRGAPYAEPDLTCRETSDVLGAILAADTEEGERLSQEALSACYARFRDEGIDLSAYNSLENAADVPAIARALGYESYNFYGVSYGTLLGLYLMRYQPEGLRSIILDSVAPPDVNFVQRVSASENRVYDKLFAACETNPACRDAYPNLEQRYFDLLKRLDEHPVTLTLRDPNTGEEYETYLDGQVLRDVVYQLLYLPDMPAIFPKLVYDLERGDFRYVQTMWPLLVFDQQLSDGMYYSIMCAENSDIDPADLDTGTLRPEIGMTARDDIESFLSVCERWQVEQLPSTIDEPVSSDIPTLLLSGNFDPITPPEYAEAAAANLTNAYRFVDPTASHGVAFLSPCVNEIMLEFLNDPASQPDGACLAQTAEAVVVPPSALTLPLVAGVNSLDNRTLTRAGLGTALLLVVLSPYVIWPVAYVTRALRNKPLAVPASDRRLRMASRVLLLVFGGLALVFAAALLTFLLIAVSSQVYAAAMTLAPSAVLLIWLGLLLLLLAVGVLAAALMMWQRRGASSAAGRIYYTSVAIAAVAFVLLIGMDGLLSLPK